MQITKGHNQFRVKAANQSAIRGVIYHSGPISRLEVSERLGLALPTITTNVNVLIGKGLVREVEDAVQPVKTLGRRTTLIDIAADSRYFLGIEMRGALRRLCVADYRGNVIRTLEDNTFYDQYEENLNATCALAKKLMQHRDVRAKLAGIGICVPGLVDSQKGILRVHPGYGWKNRNLRRDVQELLGYEGPISVENNACARAYGAYMFRQDLLRDAESFAYLFISTGIACPLFFNSLSAGGSIAGEGEVGHMVMDPDGPRCSCGNHGCLEAYSSERAVISACKEALAKGGAPRLRAIAADPAAPTVEEILTAQEEGDSLVVEVMNSAVRHMGLAVANIDNFMRPDCMLIESKLYNTPENRRLMLEVIHKNLYTETIQDVKFNFVPHDEFSGALGAVAAAVRRDMEEYVE